MATNINWQWQVENVIVGTDNLIGFYGVNYGDPIKLGEYNKSTHIRKNWSENVQLDTGSNAMYNFAYISDTEVSVNGSYPMILSGNTPTSGHGVKIRLRDVGGTYAFKVLSVKVFAFSGNDMTVPVSGVEIYMFEFGQNRWNRLYGSANPVTLTARLTPSTSHTWEIGLSIKPTAVVEKTATLRLEADIQ
jgi:hypothetical protein